MIRKHNKPYLACGMTSTTACSEERAQPVTSLKIWASYTMSPKKLQRHVESTCLCLQILAPQFKKLHTVAEKWIVPYAIGIVPIMTDEATATKQLLSLDDTPLPTGWWAKVS